jgi:DNA mismatch repair protein PMS2
MLTPLSHPTKTSRKKVVAFSTKSNGTTKENIANIFGAKTLLGITQLNLELELQPTTSQALRDLHPENDNESRAIEVVGHISKPVFGEGRQTPDRQMFFVNSRPCALPQISKAFNEVYKSFNVTQSPFIFADLKINTNAYDVNVSPDKRTILLHDQTALLESIKQSLTAMFEAQDQTVPQSQLIAKKLPAFRPQNPTRQVSTSSDDEEPPVPVSRISGLRYDQSSPTRPEREEPAQPSSSSIAPQTQMGDPQYLISKFVGRDLAERDVVEREKVLAAWVI